MTQTAAIKGDRTYVLLAVDYCSGELVEIETSASADGWEPLELIRQGMAQHFGIPVRSGSN